jgi:hypothetical protein
MTQTIKLGLYLLAASVLAGVLAAGFPTGTSAAANRVDARFQAGLVRQPAAPTGGDAGGTEGTNGGSSGEGGSQGSTQQNESQDDADAATQELMDDFVADASEEMGTTDVPDEVDDLPGDIDEENIGGVFMESSALPILNTILTRFRF